MLSYLMTSSGYFLAGKNETELPEVRRGRPGSTYVDKFPLVWNKFEQSGYVTLFAEDQPGLLHLLIF